MAGVEIGVAGGLRMWQAIFGAEDVLWSTSSVVSHMVSKTVTIDLFGLITFKRVLFEYTITTMTSKAATFMLGACKEFCWCIWR